MVNIPLFTGFYTSQVVVWDFFHRIILPIYLGWICREIDPAARWQMLPFRSSYAWGWKFKTGTANTSINDLKHARELFEHEALTIITSNLVNHIYFVAISIKEDYKTKVSGIGCPLKTFLKLENFRRSSPRTHSRGTVEGVDNFFGSRQFVSTFFGRIFGQGIFVFWCIHLFWHLKNLPDFFSAWQNLQRYEDSVEVLKDTICFLDFICIKFQMMGVESESFSSTWGPSEVTGCWNLVWHSVTRCLSIGSTPQERSHHLLAFLVSFSRESQPKAAFATGILGPGGGGVDATYPTIYQLRCLMTCKARSLGRNV